jgi:hypothetical protein
VDEDGLRRLALAMPEAEEHDHFGRPSFRVRGKIFVSAVADGAANLKLPADEHAALVAERPDGFAEIVWGSLVRTRVQLATVDEAELAELVDRAWREVAPKRLAAATPGPATPPGPAVPPSR